MRLNPVLTISADDEQDVKEEKSKTTEPEKPASTELASSEKEQESYAKPATSEPASSDDTTQKPETQGPETSTVTSNAAPAVQDLQTVPGAPGAGSSEQAPPPPMQQRSQHFQPSNVGKDSGKMFIGGLNWDTTEEGLVAYFSKYGEVIDHTIMRDNHTGKSRGFGFLTFKDPRSVDEVIKTDHILDGKLIDPKRAIAREEQDKVGKIFVGGIDPMVNEKEFYDFFAQFGSIIDAQLMIDKDTGRSRGFGFITYDSPDAVDRVTVNKYLSLKGKSMEVKRAEPRGQHQQNQMQQQQQQAQQPYGYGYGQMPFPNQQGGYPAAGQPTPEMMQDYWQRMQQWYMYQQQQAAQNQGEGGADAQTGEQPEQPLNPQQQQEQQSSETSERDSESRQSHEHSNYNNNNNHGSNSYGSRYDNPHRDSRRANLPKGPRRAPPSGPSGNYRGRGGYQRRGGYHPYGRRDNRR